MIKSIVLGATFLVVATVVANAQPQYAYSYYGYGYRASPAPQSWSYDPYTSGLSPCPQWMPGDLTTCSQQMPPTYGQPSYWSR